jgi:hypothetical protein
MYFKINFQNLVLRVPRKKTGEVVFCVYIVCCLRSISVNLK